MLKLVSKKIGKTDLQKLLTLSEVTAIIFVIVTVAFTSL